MEKLAAMNTAVLHLLDENQADLTTDAASALMESFFQNAKDLEIHFINLKSANLGGRAAVAKEIELLQKDLADKRKIVKEQVSLLADFETQLTASFAQCKETLDACGGE